MREAAAPALPAVRSIAQIWWRADMVSGSSLVSPVNVTDSGKAHVNREAACSGKRARKSSADGDRSEVLTGRLNLSVPGWRVSAGPGIQMRAQNLYQDSGFARFKRVYARLNALCARAAG